MHLNLSCPQCQKALRIAAEHAGKSIRCPGCTYTFRVPAESEPTPAAVPTTELPTEKPAPLPPRPAKKLDIDDDPPRRPRNRSRDRDRESPRVSVALSAESRPAWDMVRQAMNLIHWGIVGNVLAPLAVFAVGVLFSLVVSEMSKGARETALIPFFAILIVAALISIVSFFCIQIGLATCCCVPMESKAKTLAIAMLVVNLHVWPMMMISRIVEAGFRSETHGYEEVVILPVTSGIGTAIGIATTVLFVLFMRKIADYLRDDTLAAKIRWYLVFYGCIVGFLVMALLISWIGSWASKSKYDYESERDYPRSGYSESRDKGYYESRSRSSSSSSSSSSDGAVALAIVIAIIAIAVAVVNVVWMLHLVRGTRDLIERATRVPLEPTTE